MVGNPTDDKSSEEIKQAEKKWAEEAAGVVQKRYAQIFDRSFDCVYVYDLERTFIYGNRAHPIHRQ